MSFSTRRWRPGGQLGPVFTDHYLKAKQQLPGDREDAVHQRLRGLGGLHE